MVTSRAGWHTGFQLVLCAILTAVLSLTGCGTPAGTPPELTSPVPPSSAAPTRPIAPKTVDIPSVKISADVQKLGLDANQELDIRGLDQKPLDAGFYRVGDKGRTMIAGHINWARKPAVFSRLDEVKPGAQIIVKGEDGVRQTFVVYRTQQVSKSAFPSQVVYGDSDTPELAVVTCGGRFRPEVRSYEDNVLVFARIAYP